MKGIMWAGAALFAVLGLLLLAGGLRLAALGGSLYYFVAGATLIATGILLAWRKAIAAWIYAGLSLGTMLWSLAEVGWDPWGLLPRVGVVGILGLWFAIPTVRRTWVLPSESFQPIRYWSALLGLLSCMFPVLLVVAAYIHSLPPAVLPAARDISSAAAVHRDNDWPLYGNTARGDRFSPAERITPANVGELKLAWTFRTGDKLPPTEAANARTLEVTPIQVGNALFFCTANNVLFALDADSGRELWHFDPQVDTSRIKHRVCRGVSYAPGSSTDTNANISAGTHRFCDARLLMATLDNRLHALDVATGKHCSDFGVDGVVDLTVGMGRNLPGYSYPTSPPVIIGGIVVLGTFHLDNQSTNEPPGVVRAFDTRTGQLLWAWEVLEPFSRHTAPEPGGTYARNTANAWSVFSADVDHGLIFIPTGGPPPDFFGGQRTAAQDRYNNSVVALDAQTGDVRWSFQTSHHDLWDLDNASQPVIADLDLQNGRIPALILPTKRGEIFLLDRLTGKPLFPIEERRVPQNAVQGERLSPTQPYQVGFPSFAPARLTEADMWGATLFDQLLCRIEFRRLRYEGQFTPPSLQGSVIYPAYFGVFNWGSVAVDPERQLMFVNPTWQPSVAKLVPRAVADAAGVIPWGTTSELGKHGGLHRQDFEAQAGTPYAISEGPFLSPLGYPCHRPPWGEVGVIDLRTQRLLWHHALGTTRDIAPFGLALPMGMPNLGGAVLTRSGVAFIGAAMDDYVRAFDVITGRELWKGRLPAGGQANPITYLSERTGRQYVVIAAGGSLLGTKAGDYLVAYAL